MLCKILVPGDYLCKIKKNYFKIYRENYGITFEKQLEKHRKPLFMVHFIKKNLKEHIFAQKKPRLVIFNITKKKDRTLVVFQLLMVNIINLYRKLRIIHIYVQL